MGIIAVYSSIIDTVFNHPVAGCGIVLISDNSARNAGNMIQENYPGIRVTIMDTTLATLMQGLMIQEIVRFQRSGADYDALIKRADEIKDTWPYFLYR